MLRSPEPTQVLLPCSSVYKHQSISLYPFIAYTLIQYRVQSLCKSYSVGNLTSYRLRLSRHGSDYICKHTCQRTLNNTLDSFVCNTLKSELGIELVDSAVINAAKRRLVTVCFSCCYNRCTKIALIRQVLEVWVMLDHADNCIWIQCLREIYLRLISVSLP